MFLLRVSDMNLGKKKSKAHSADTCLLSHVRLFAAMWEAARQAPLSMGFSRQKYWSVLPCPLPGDLPDPGMEPSSVMSSALAGGFLTTSAT